MPDHDARATLAVLARVLIPGGAGQPGADDLALHGDPVDQVLALSPAHAAPLRAFLARAGDSRDLAAIDALAQRDPDGFAALSFVLANAYFMHPATRAAIGYPGQEARDSSVGLSDADMALVAEVSQRGPIYRDA